MPPTKDELNAARRRRYRERHPERVREQDRKYREKCKEAFRERNRRYVNKRRHIKNAVNAAYRARRRGHTVKLTPEQRAEMRALYKRARDLTKTTGIKHHVDHIYPLKHELFCGLHVPANCQVIPASMNSRKKNHIALDMLERVYVNVEHHDD